MERNNGKKRFASALLVYVLVLACLLAVGLLLLNAYLKAYEQAGPETALEAFLVSLDEEKAYALAEESLMSFDTNLASPEEIFTQRVKPLLAGGLRAEPDASESTEARPVYRLFAGAQPVGSLALEQTGKGRFGLPVWDVASAGLDFSFLQGEGPRSVTVPEDFTVLCNGYPLDESYVSSVLEIRGELEYLREAGYALPGLVEYTVPDAPLSAEFRILDAAGNEYSPDTDFEALAAQRLLGSCTEEERARLEDFARRFAAAYVAFMGGTKSSYSAGYRELLPLVDGGSELAQRLADARGGMYWTHNRRNELQNVEVRALIALGDGVYVCDIGFPVNTQTLTGYVINDLSARLFVSERDGALRAFDMLSY